MAITINVNGESINYPETGDTNWSDEATDFAVQTASAFGKLGLASGTSVDIPQTLDVTGNVTLDANLSVGGNASVTGNTTLTGNITVNGNSNLGNGSSDTIAVTGILNVDSGVLYVDPTNNRVGINDTTPSVELDVNGSVAVSGTLGVTGDVAVNTNKFNITATSGNTAIAGTLGVTGDVAVNTNKFNITASSGNTLIAGTLGVTGNATLTGRLLNSDGSEASPSLTFSSDTDNGFYHIGPNNFGVVAGGAKVSDISSLGTLNGTLGIDYRNLLQTQQTTFGTVLTGTTQIPYDNTIPQITEGIEVLSRSITPKSSNSILEIDFQIIIASNTSERLAAALFKVGTNNALICSFTYSLTNETKIITGKHRILSGSTSAQTFTIRAGGDQAATRTINGTAGSQYYGGVLNTFIMIKEYL